MVTRIRSISVAALAARFVMAASCIGLLASCTVLANMQGKGDLQRAMENRDRIMMRMGPGERRRYVSAKQSETLQHGAALFGDRRLGRNGMACGSCHPDGGTTGGEAQLPRRDYRLPIPALVGSAATFPKYKTASNAVVTLGQMNNVCIELFMEGRPLKLDSDDAVALVYYVTSLSGDSEVEVVE